jgi:hypothetical protein
VDEDDFNSEEEPDRVRPVYCPAVATVDYSATAVEHLSLDDRFRAILQKLKNLFSRYVGVHEQNDARLGLTLPSFATRRMALALQTVTVWEKQKVTHGGLFGDGKERLPLIHNAGQAGPHKFRGIVTIIDCPDGLSYPSSEMIHADRIEYLQCIRDIGRLCGESICMMSRDNWDSFFKKELRF